LHSQHHHSWHQIALKELLGHSPKVDRA
jgi:hypothetical protein